MEADFIKAELLNLRRAVRMSAKENDLVLETGCAQPREVDMIAIVVRTSYENEIARRQKER